jgi:hypothetical protein
LTALPPGSLLTLIGLIGTTVVPYNLFLHASAVSERWQDPRDLRTSRIDSAVAIGLCLPRHPAARRGRIPSLDRESAGPREAERLYLEYRQSLTPFVR